MSKGAAERVGPAKCRQCNEPLTSPMVCRHCRSVYSAEGVDHFALLGVGRAYDVDLEEVSSKFVELSRQVHPDYFAGSSEPAQRMALRNSARLNEAYRTLRDPLERAEYLLELAGGRSSAEDKSVPPELLAEAMEVREEIEQAKHQGQSERLDEVRQEILRQREQILVRIASAARRAAEPGVDATVLRELRQQLNAISYVNNLLRQL